MRKIFLLFQTIRLYQILGFGLLGAGYFLWTWSHELAEFGGDNAYYLLMAQHFSPWSANSVVAEYFANRSQYPPLFPLVLAMFGGGNSVLAAHLITTSFLLLSFLVFYKWLGTLGISEVKASLLTILFALLPGTYMQTLSVHSESLYLLLLLLSLHVVSAAENQKRMDWLWIAATTVAGATLTRSAGISLLVAFIIYILLYRPVRSWLLAVIAGSPMILWNMLRGNDGDSYLRSFMEKSGSDMFATLINHIEVQAQALWYGWAHNFSYSKIGLVIVSIVGAICLVGMLRRLYARKLDGIYATIYLLLVLIWPFPAEAQRFMFVIMPVLLIQGVLLIEQFRKVELGKRVYHPSFILLIAAVALVSMPMLFLTASRFLTQVPTEYADFRRSSGWYVPKLEDAYSNIVFNTVIRNDLRDIKAMIPEGACIYSIKPSVVAFYSMRLSMLPPREYLSDSKFYTSLNKTGCRFFYLVGFSSPSYSTPFYPSERLQHSLRFLHIARIPNRNNTPVVAILAEITN